MLSACLLAACSMFTTAPVVDVPEHFPSADDNRETLANLPCLAWWRQLNDPVLNQLLTSGLSNNNDLQIARANLDQARGQLRSVQLSWVPFVNIYAGFTQNPVFGNIGTFYGVWPQYFLNLLQLPFLQKQAEYNLALRRAQIDAVRLTLIGQITSGYLTYLAQIRQRDLLIALQLDLQELIKIQQQALAGGISEAQPVALLKSQEQQLVAQLQIVQSNLVASQNALRFLLNANPGAIPVGIDFARLDETMIKPASQPATVLANRPDLRAAELQVRVAGEGVKVSAANLFPAMQLDRFMAMASGDGSLGAPTSPTAASEAYVNWQITPKVLGLIEAAEGDYKAATYDYIKTVRQILREVDNDFAANRYFAARLSAVRMAHAHAREELSLQQDLYQKGIISYRQLVEARLLADSLALTVNQSKLEYLLAQVLLYQDLAGGYRSGAELEKTPADAHAAETQ